MLQNTIEHYGILQNTMEFYSLKYLFTAYNGRWQSHLDLWNSLVHYETIYDVERWDGVWMLRYDG